MGYLKTQNRLGVTNKNNFGTEMKVVKVLPNDKVLIEFEDWKKYQKEILWTNFKSGNVKNPYDKIRYGVGYMGAGEYKVESILGIHDKSYDTWQNMLERCYSEKHREKHSAYNDCTVCEKWHNYQNFAKWYKKNEYPIDGRLHLDKDILKEGNTVYAPEFCLLVPQRINMIFMSKSRNDDLPNAIKMNIGGTYTSHYNGKRLAKVETLEEAIRLHDEAKRKHIKQVAEEYKDKIPKKLYKALINW
jgi:hypothetical protein